MPFPLNTLDYNTYCRLRELVTPSEAYDLQLAAPHLHTLKPIQKVKFTLDSYISVNSDNELSVQCGDHLTLAVNNVAEDYKLHI
uniref:PepX_C domain-containing protein n=1 Tax=Panagrellus redivivus TaxID=6233 RepID=A0A7E4WAC2_PANRE